MRSSPSASTTRSVKVPPVSQARRIGRSSFSWRQQGFARSSASRYELSIAEASPEKNYPVKIAAKSFMAVTS